MIAGPDRRPPMFDEIDPYTFSMKDFGQRLRQLRKERGLTQGDLARLAKIDIMQVSRYERGLGLPSLETAIALARVLETSTDLLFLGKAADEPAAPEEHFRHLPLVEVLRQADHELMRRDVDMVVALVEAFLLRKRMKKLVNE
jgi:transcriptional regulator with XRE-family HTH domain